MKDLILLVAGALISAWTGMLTAKYFEYSAQVTRTRDILLNVLTHKLPAIAGAKSEADVHEVIGYLTIQPITALAAQGQWRASKQIGNIDLQLVKELKAEWKLLNENLAACRDNPSRELVAIVHAEAMREVLKKAIKGVDKIKPDWLFILLGSTIGNPLVKHIVVPIVNFYRLFSTYIRTGQSFAETRSKLSSKDAA